MNMRTIPEEDKVHAAGSQTFGAATQARRDASDKLERAMWHTREGRHGQAKIEFEAAIADYRAAATHFNNLADILEGLLKEQS